MARYAVRDRIRQLDPERDCWEIYWLHSKVEFPWDVTRALEVALYRTYCVPSIGRLLDDTQEFAQRTQKRYDDTALLLGEVVEHGFSHPRARAAIRRINRIHHRFPISNEDLRYVLSTFVVVPLRWLDRFGWRPPTEHERVATHAFYRRLGTLMGIRDIPATYPEMVALSDDYERAHYRYTPASARVGTATRELFVGWFRPAPAPLVRLGVHALLDRPVLEAFGFRPAPAPMVALVAGALRARARAVRLLPQRRAPTRIADSWLVRSYPDGYEIDGLGPDGTRLPGASQPAG